MVQNVTKYIMKQRAPFQLALLMSANGPTNNIYVTIFLVIDIGVV